MPKERRLISLKEAAAYLGMSQSNLYRMLKHGEITALKIGSSWYFEYAKIDAWIDAQPAGQVRPEVRKPRK